MIGDKGYTPESIEFVRPGLFVRAGTPVKKLDLRRDPPVGIGALHGLGASRRAHREVQTGDAMTDITTQVAAKLAELGYADVKSFQEASG